METVDIVLYVSVILVVIMLVLYYLLGPPSKESFSIDASGKVEFDPQEKIALKKIILGIIYDPEFLSHNIEVPDTFNKNEVQDYRQLIMQIQDEVRNKRQVTGEQLDKLTNYLTLYIQRSSKTPQQKINEIQPYLQAAHNLESVQPEHFSLFSKAKQLAKDVANGSLHATERIAKGVGHVTLGNLELGTGLLVGGLTVAAAAKHPQYSTPTGTAAGVSAGASLIDKAFKQYKSI
jgi:hypothetical protein